MDGRKSGGPRGHALHTLILVVCLAALGIIVHAEYRSLNPAPAAEAAALSDTAELTPEPTPEPEPVTLKISVVGDCTLGKDPYYSYDISVNHYYEMYGEAYFMDNVRSIFEADDLTIANFEGVLSDYDVPDYKEFNFKGPAEFAGILTDGSIEAVNTANNHSHDYGDQGYSDTLAALDEEGVVNFGYDKIAVMDVKGVKIGLVGIYELRDHLERIEQLRRNIARVKRAGAQLIIVVFHWGNELDKVPDSNQTTLGRLAIDLGADLVCGHHAHILQGIEQYKGRYIVYGLGNFCFGGKRNPTEMDTMIFQQTFTVVGDEVLMDDDIEIIPCCVSSVWDYNDYRPTPVKGDEAARIRSKIDERSAAIPRG